MKFLKERNLINKSIFCSFPCFGHILTLKHILYLGYLDTLKKPFIRPAWTCTLFIGILDSVVFVFAMIILQT